ncbi:MAG: hypothetical protein LBH57_09120 [Treponema sp.]|nr:hypothetical protein [Treponema sp.]
MGLTPEPSAPPPAVSGYYRAVRLLPAVPKVKACHNLLSPGIKAGALSEQVIRVSE